MRTIGRGWVATCTLPKFACDVVEVQLEKGMALGRHGWDNPELCDIGNLVLLLEEAVKRKDWESATCYSAMLAARKHNEVEIP